MTALLDSWNNLVDSNYLYCIVPLFETKENLFLTAEYSTKVWSYYINATGLHGPWVKVKQTVLKHREAP